MLVVTVSLCIGTIPACHFWRSSSIEVIDNYTQVNFDSIQSGSLVIFDVDETLIQPEDIYLINEHTPEAATFLKKVMDRHPEVHDWELLQSIIAQEAQRPLLEPNCIAQINQLKARGVLVIACTFMNTGPYSSISSLEKWRYYQLKSLGFEGSMSDTIISLSGSTKNPIFYRGILVTDKQDKGAIITLLLHNLNLHPPTIIAFDDTLSNLISIEAACKQLNIAYKGYHYRGFKSRPWNQSLAEIQWEYLIAHNHWISDQEAQAMANRHHAEPIPRDNPV